MTFEWANGRNLQSITNGNETITMQYNANGMRTRQDNDDYTLHYYYDSNNNMVGLNFDGSMLYFYYDDNGSVTSFKYNNAMYYYIKNLQGDIVKIIDHLGNTKVTYTYDAWGKVLSQTDTSIYNLANLNPFRYRGYVYDYQTGLYYLQSRYYDPITGRFLNADVYCDTQTSVLGTNMFTYCGNNSIMYIDENGCWNSSDHTKMTKDKGFKGDSYKTVRDWTYNADAYPCESTGTYSAPFHGRDNALEIGLKLYNLAVEIKKNKKTKKFIIGSSKSGYTRVDFLKYNNANNKNETKNETKKAQNNFLKKINVNNWKTQSQILLGLALHTLQDYSAHVITVNLISSESDYYPSAWATNEYHEKNVMIYEVDEKMGLSNSDIEDNVNVLPWRFTFAKEITRTIYNRWTSNKKISKLYCTKGKSYKDNYGYKRTTGFSWWKKYWYISSVKYYYHC